MSVLQNFSFTLCKRCNLWLGSQRSFWRSLRIADRQTNEPFRTKYNAFATWRWEMSSKIHRRFLRQGTTDFTQLPGDLKVTAYATASEYRWGLLRKHIEEEGLYESQTLPSDLEDAMFLTAKYVIDREPRNIVIFRRGTVVFWNLPEEEQLNFKKSLRPFELEPYDRKVVRRESETLNYTYASKEDTSGKTRIKHDEIILSPSGESTLDRYVLSDGLMQSVQLAVWEACLADYIETIEVVTENLREGGRLQLSRKEVLRKTGELFNLSHLINLTSDLLDTPDFYWDRQELERLYRQSRVYFSIPSRTKTCSEIILILSMKCGSNG
ncbi:required for meiotic nuclear division protein 1 homolog isoform X2 [Watersipora subatra]|uniref:required for meiotic nuclear division protein 1 homolog isoform X2 n=1 Tax=Watersipora subatra TaxID=2589382 RepID=UPI00355C02E4